MFSMYFKGLNFRIRLNHRLSLIFTVTRGHRYEYDGINQTIWGVIMKRLFYRFKHRHRYKIKKIIGVILGIIGLLIIVNIISIEGLLFLIGIVLIALGLLILNTK